eukprot:1187750-Prorocentrum_minimum.AAC.5
MALRAGSPPPLPPIRPPIRPPADPLSDPLLTPFVTSGGGAVRVPPAGSGGADGSARLPPPGVAQGRATRGRRSLPLLRRAGGTSPAPTPKQTEY